MEIKKILFIFVIAQSLPLAALDFTALDFTSFGFSGIAYQNSSYELPGQNSDPYKLDSIGLSMAQYSGALVGGYVDISFVMPYSAQIVGNSVAGEWDPGFGFAADVLLGPAAQYKSGPLQILGAIGYHGRFFLWEDQYIYSYGLGGEARIIVSTADWFNFNTGISGAVDSNALGSKISEETDFQNAVHYKIFSGIGFNF